MTPKRQKQLIREAVEAHSDLNIFAAVVAILEGGTMSAGAQPDDFKLIAMSKLAQDRCLARYDRAMGLLGHPYGAK